MFNPSSVEAIAPSTRTQTLPLVEKPSLRKRVMAEAMRILIGACVGVGEVCVGVGVAIGIPAFLDSYSATKAIVAAVGAGVVRETMRSAELLAGIWLLNKSLPLKPFFKDLDKKIRNYTEE